MEKFGRIVTKHRKLILIIAVLLMIPSIIGYLGTRINYDVLKYLPEDFETVKGQEILLDEFGKGAFAIVVVEGMDNKNVAELKKKYEELEHVESVIWYNSVMDISTPLEILPDTLREKFHKGDSTIMAVFMDDATSADASIQTVAEMRKISTKQCFISGMTAFVLDLKEIAESEEPVYILLAVLLSCIILGLFMDSWIISVLFIAGIGITIIYNMGSNIIFGEISYITKALSAVLQLGVTMDYSIFLWHSYEERRAFSPGDKSKAMSEAIAATITSVTGSSITTIAGFIAMCFMTFTLGLDLGLVMAKGVLFGVIGSVTILPALILTFEKAVEKTRHRPLMPRFSRLTNWVVKHPKILIGAFIVFLIPAAIGYFNTSVYYNLDKSVPQTLPFAVANDKLQNEYDMSTTHMVLVSSDISKNNMKKMIEEIDGIKGVNATLAMESVLGPTFPDEALPESVKGITSSDRHKLIIISSKYKVATDAVNRQIDRINKVVKKYDSSGLVIGEGPCTKDLIETTDLDFKVVSIISILAIFLIILIVTRSLLLPAILVAVIELAIFINLGIPYYTGTVLPFIASICVSTIQLGSTVDYAILMTNRYKEQRLAGRSKKDAISFAHTISAPSIVISAFSFFAATMGVGIYSDIDIISALCTLMARGALISMTSVILILPAAFMLFDKAICRTTKGMKKILRDH